jgi:hypothetical protein
MKCVKRKIIGWVIYTTIYSWGVHPYRNHILLYQCGCPYTEAPNPVSTGRDLLRTLGIGGTRWDFFLLAQKSAPTGSRTRDVEECLALLLFHGASLGASVEVMRLNTPPSTLTVGSTIA